MNAWVTYRTASVKIPRAQIKLMNFEKKGEVFTGLQKIRGKLVRRKIHQSELLSMKQVR